MKTVVLVDSDALSRTLLSHSLAGGGWRVLEAEDGEAGLDLVLKHKPAALLCDIRTSKRNGYNVCRSLREHPQGKATRVILTTVSRFTNDRDTAFSVGADDYLIKPILPRDLMQSLAKCDESPAESQAAAPAPASVTAPAPVETAAVGPTLVRFWGVRGSLPTPGPQTAGVGGNTSCVEVRVGDQIIVLDAGSGIRKLGLALMKEFKGGPFSVTMLISHTHWDHIQGFPFFIPAYSPKVNVRVLGYEGAVHGLRGALFEQMQSAFFPVGLHQMAGRVNFEELSEMEFDLGPIKVRTIYANHPGICLGYRLCTPQGDVVYMPDHEAYERHEIERQKAAGENNPQGIEHARAQDEKVVAFLRDADVIIADSQYDAAEYPTRLGWGHTCADDTVALAVRAGARRLCLFHHDPDHNDEKVEAMAARGQELAAAAGSPLQVIAALEGLEVALQQAPAAS